MHVTTGRDTKKNKSKKPWKQETSSRWVQKPYSDEDRTTVGLEWLTGWRRGGEESSSRSKWQTEAWGLIPFSPREGVELLLSEQTRRSQHGGDGGWIPISNDSYTHIHINTRGQMCYTEGQIFTEQLVLWLYQCKLKKKKISLTTTLTPI